MKNLYVILIFSFLFAQDSQSFRVSSQKYFTDVDGKVKMFINVWGHVNQPGLHEIYEGMDFATLISIVGGPQNGANLSEVKLFRESPDNNGQSTYEIDLEKFLISGDRSDFVKLLPNDTVIIPEKLSNYVISKVNIISVFLNIINIYLQSLRISS